MEINSAFIQGTIIPEIAWGLFHVGLVILILLHQICFLCSLLNNLPGIIFNDTVTLKNGPSDFFGCGIENNHVGRPSEIMKPVHLTIKPGSDTYIINTYLIKILMLDKNINRRL